MASQISRIFFIDQKIRSKGKITVREIADRCDVSNVTAKRDIEAMRDRLNAPIYYDFKTHAYRYKEEFQLLSFAGEQIFHFYAIVKGLLKNENYLPLTAEYSRTVLLQKITELLPDEYQELSERVTYINSDYEKIDFTRLRMLLQSMYNSKILVLDYATKAQSVNRRKIEPHRLVCYGSKWYLIAYCHLRKELRIFSLSRIQNLTETDEKFSKQVNLTESNTFLTESFGIAKNRHIKIATILFSEPASQYVKNQVWHPEQKTREINEEGKLTLELKLPYGQPEELIGRVLKYGQHAEITKPLQLRDQWLYEIRNTYLKYYKRDKQH